MALEREWVKLAGEDAELRSEYALILSLINETEIEVLQAKREFR